MQEQTLPLTHNILANVYRKKSANRGKTLENIWYVFLKHTHTHTHTNHNGHLHIFRTNIQKLSKAHMSGICWNYIALCTRPTYTYICLFCRSFVKLIQFVRRLANTHNLQNHSAQKCPIYIRNNACVSQFWIRRTMPSPPSSKSGHIHKATTRKMRRQKGRLNHPNINKNLKYFLCVIHLNLKTISIVSNN